MKAIMITRDRVTYAQRCLSGLLRAGLDVHIVDHGSTWEPMLDWLGHITTQVARYEPAPDGGPPLAKRVHVHWKANAHPRDIWTNGTLASIVRPDERYIVTDCDIVPPEAPDWVEYLGALLDAALDRSPAIAKAGCGLITDDLPDHFVHADRVRMWEAQYQSWSTTVPVRESHPVWGRMWHWQASVDTTLALYPSAAEIAPYVTLPDGMVPFRLDPSVRTANSRYMVRHLPWYENTADGGMHLSDELKHYFAHAEHGMWRNPDGFTDDHGLETPHA